MDNFELTVAALNWLRRDKDCGLVSFDVELKRGDALTGAIGFDTTSPRKFFSEVLPVSTLEEIRIGHKSRLVQNAPNPYHGSFSSPNYLYVIFRAGLENLVFFDFLNDSRYKSVGVLLFDGRRIEPHRGASLIHEMEYHPVAFDLACRRSSELLCGSLFSGRNNL